MKVDVCAAIKRLAVDRILEIIEETKIEKDGIDPTIYDDLIDRIMKEYGMRKL